MFDNVMPFLTAVKVVLTCWPDEVMSIFVTCFVALLMCGLVVNAKSVL